MHNPYQVDLAVIKKIVRESNDVNRLVLEFEDQNLRENFNFESGQFIEASVLGYNEAPFTFASSPYQKGSFEIAVRSVGEVTRAINNMKVGEKLGIRGPLGNGFPMENLKKRNILFVSGGCGFVPLKSVIENLLASADFVGKMQVFYGARSYDDLLFKIDFGRWKEKGLDLNLTIDKEDKTCAVDSKCSVGLVTEFFKKVKLVEKPAVLVCGPPIMVKFVVAECDKLKILHSDIYLSLERRMECGIGVCEHCAIGPYYVCKDGPVFSLDKIEKIPGVI